MKGHPGVEKLAALTGEVEQLRRDLGDVQERLDFTERLLAQQRQSLRRVLSVSTPPLHQIAHPPIVVLDRRLAPFDRYPEGVGTKCGGNATWYAIASPALGA